MTEMERTYYLQESLLIALGKVMLFFVVLLLRKLMAKDSLAGLADTEWLRFIFFPVFTIFTISAMISTAGNIQNQTQEKVFVLIAFGLAGMNIVVFYLIKDILKREARIREDRIFRLQVKNQTSMYRSVSENFDKQRKKTHEYKNQMLCIEALIKKKRYEELEGYVEGICEKLNKDLDSISTNNVIVDAILNTKYQEMRDQNVVFVFKINDLSRINMKDEDIVIVLSNLLNNAIEACEKCKGKRIVKLKFVNEDDMIIISVRNTYENEIIYDGKEIKTSKCQDVDEHGIGIIEKYEGSHVITNDGQEFCFSIIIPQG